ncbi:MAG: hypothetical protein VXZ40_00870 [Nanoarchaeota archaeon]|nr:hypothetical protein [Nanoarchaeota archaeon]
MKHILKRASEKPIEIFIALFVVLAVAMVLLQMFGGQITSKQEELKNLADENKLKQARQDVEDFCKQSCANIDSQLDTVTYCKTKFNRAVDLNNNDLTTDYNSDYSIVGVCEDAIYCASVYECRELNMRTCAQILCNYFEDEWGYSQLEATNKLLEFIQPGECSINEDNKANHWYYIIEDELSCA